MVTIKAWTDIQPDRSLLPLSPIHTVALSHAGSGKVWVKREDAFGFGFAGTKMRKYASLIPFMLHNGVEQAALIGGAFSNNLLILPQILSMYGIRSQLFIRGEETTAIIGNHFLIRLLHSQQQIRWVSRSDWVYVDEIVAAYAESETAQGRKVMPVPEGAFMPQALPGAITLADDIYRNEGEHAVQFQHIFSDAGTGFATLAAMLHDVARFPNRQWHILLLADDEITFRQKLQQMHAWYCTYRQQPMPIPKNFSLYRHSAFGKVGQSELLSVKYMARNHGIICDPVYTGKLWAVVQQTLQQQALDGEILVLQSGGASVMGFNNTLSKHLHDD
jgi:1-aminocyclopropane-1-carboxylate deaminase/D-cysteine desulfhydrase-like pyridoxal-dependent ACC family enzyme